MFLLFSGRLYLAVSTRQTLPGSRVHADETINWIMSTLRHILEKICDKHEILLFFDEIQCGYGRTGKMWASQNFDVVPDIMTVGKAIAGGLPMSAVISTPEIMDKWPLGTHGTTFGGNPCISDVRGIGLMVAIEFSHKDGSPAPDIWAKVKKGCLERHMLTLNCGVNGNGMRFATPLNVKKEEIDEGFSILEASIQAL